MLNKTDDLYVCRHFLFIGSANNILVGVLLLSVIRLVLYGTRRSSRLTDQSALSRVCKWRKIEKKNKYLFTMSAICIHFRIQSQRPRSRGIARPQFHRSSLNLSKTECLLIGTRQQLAKIKDISIFLTPNIILTPDESAWNLGFVFEIGRASCRERV